MDAWTYSEEEANRLRALGRYRIVDTDPEPAFDQITKGIASILNVSGAAIAFIGARRHWLKSHIGLDNIRFSRTNSICDYTIKQLCPVTIVRDLWTDERFRNTTISRGDVNLRFYAGAPIVTPDRFAIGTVFAWHSRRRAFAPNEADVLLTAARAVEHILEKKLLTFKLETSLAVHRKYLERFADEEAKRIRIEDQLQAVSSYDVLTKLPNRAAFFKNLEEARLWQLAREGRSVFVLFIDLNNFKEVNDAYGHRVGDQCLLEVSNRLRRLLAGRDSAARLGGDEFTMILHRERAAEKLDEIVEAITKQLSFSVKISDHSINISASVGAASLSGTTGTLDDLVHEADVSMYSAKRARSQRTTREIARAN